MACKSAKIRREVNTDSSSKKCASFNFLDFLTYFAFAMLILVVLILTCGLVAIRDIPLNFARTPSARISNP
jgi:hypothetical protein